jgi:lysophospholipase L1-like esterase
VLNIVFSWPNLLLARLQKDPELAKIAVLNQAAGGNCILSQCLGPPAVGRIGRDVISHQGVKYGMIFEGVNDLGNSATDTNTQNQLYNNLIAAYVKMVGEMKAKGIKVLGATITPFSSPGSEQSYSHPNREATRQKINTWIKTNGTFDAFVDFAAVVADPAIPARLASQYNTANDWLHPNVLGFQAMADAIPLSFFKA